MIKYINIFNSYIYEKYRLITKNHWLQQWYKNQTMQKNSNYFQN